jgi:hypothetical protein
MITISLKTNSERAIDFARKMMDSKKQLQKEIKEDAKSPEFLKIINDLILQNETQKSLNLLS